MTIRIAVIGQFNSGKSSFINSLLGIELLSVKAVHCTSALTELRTAEDGEPESFTIRFRRQDYWNANGPGILAELERNGIIKDTAARKDYALKARTYPGHDPITVELGDADDLSEAAQALREYCAADGRISPFVESIEIVLRRSGLPCGVTLIDTPGLNNPFLNVIEELVALELDALIMAVPSDAGELTASDLRTLTQLDAPAVAVAITQADLAYAGLGTRIKKTRELLAALPEGAGSEVFTWSTEDQDLCERTLLINWIEQIIKENPMPRIGKDGSLNLSSLTISDKAGRVRIRLGVNELGTPEVALLDEAGVTRSMIALGENGQPSISLYNEDGALRMNHAVDDDGNPRTDYRGNDESAEIALQAKDGIATIQTSCNDANAVLIESAAGRSRVLTVYLEDSDKRRALLVSSENYNGFQAIENDLTSAELGTDEIGKNCELLVRGENKSLALLNAKPGLSIYDKSGKRKIIGT